MSMSSEISYASTTSSSSSGSCTDDDVDDDRGTGSFSSSASFSSLSTVVAVRPSVQPFGKPEYNYFWVKVKSKTYPKQSYYYNCKSHSVVWSRPIPKNVSLPTYTSGWNLERKNLSDSDQGLIVSDEEDALLKRRRLRIKKRNRRLLLEDKNDSIKVVSINKTLKSKKSLETFWKLFRLPGESIADVKQRLLNLTDDDTQVKIEKISDNECKESNLGNLTGFTIKQEPLSDDEGNCNALQIVQEKMNNKNTDEFSDSDPENVSALIKQEYMMNYDNFEDSELENQEIEESNEDSEEEYEESLDDDDESESELEQEPAPEQEVMYGLQSRRSLSNKKMMENCSYLQSEDHHNDEDNDKKDEDDDDDDDAYFPLNDFCDVEIIENDGDNISAQFFDTFKKNDEACENINWTFEKSNEIIKESQLTRLALNPMFKISQRKRKKKQKKTIPKMLKKSVPAIEIKEEPVQINEDEDAPIICDMWGTRTINYNHPDKIKVPKWTDHSKLSDSDDSSTESVNSKVIKNYIENLSNDNKVEKNATALELKNWFPKKKRSKTTKNSDASWFGSDSSTCSDLNNENDYDTDNRDSAFQSIKYQNYKGEKSSDLEKSVITNVSVVKVEKSSRLDPEEEKIINVVESEENTKEKNVDTAYTSDSESSSSNSCSCSRSSCSCNSSSGNEDSDAKVDEH